MSAELPKILSNEDKTCHEQYNLQSIKEDLEQNAHRLEYIDKAGLYLMQKCEPPNCVQTQNELDEFHVILNAVLAKLISNGEKAASLAKDRVSRLNVCFITTLVVATYVKKF